MATLQTLGSITALTDEELLLTIINIRNSRRQYKPKQETKPKPPSSQKVVASKKPISDEAIIASLSPAAKAALIAKLTGGKP